MQLKSCLGHQATQRPALTRVHPELGRSERVWGWATAPSPAHAIHLHPARAAAVEVSTIERDVHHARGTAPAEQPATESEVISWTSYWWPVQAVVNLDPKIPVHVDLLGKSLVVWGDSQGNWHCLEDKCPHRLAPLSEGRVEKGAIMCCYHGWTFSGAGACTSIPQLAGDSKAHASACSSKRSCVAAYPTKVAHGLLWIWPEAGLEAAAKAAATQPHEMAYGGDMAEWYVRDIPLRSDTLLENLVDPGHVPYSHHGVMGNRYKPLRAFPDMKVEAVDKTGMATVGAFGAKPLHLQFLAPFRVTYYTDPKLPGTQLAAVPTKPGWSRVFLNGPQPRASPQLKMLPLPVQWLMRIRLGVTAINHITARSAIFDGDDYMLHVAQRLLPPSKGLGNAVARSYYMPAPEDAMVIALRKWFEKHGGEMPTASAADEAAMQLLPKEQVLDRWHQHTKHCSHCLKGLATLDKVQSINVVVGLAAAVALVAQAVAAAALARAPALVAAASSAAANPLASWWQACQAAGVQHGIMACAVLAAACYGLYRFLAGMRQLFYYEDYVHAERD